MLVLTVEPSLCSSLVARRFLIIAAVLLSVLAEGRAFADTYNHIVNKTSGNTDYWWSIKIQEQRLSGQEYEWILIGDHSNAEDQSPDPHPTMPGYWNYHMEVTGLPAGTFRRQILYREPNSMQFNLYSEQMIQIPAP